MPFIANSPGERAAMLRAAGFDSIADMWKQAGVDFPYPRLDGFPEGRSEYEVFRHLEKLAAKNAVGIVSFLGGGCYDHIIPAAVDAIVSRGEFFTAYTPYQAEASQGTLQAIYEFQTAVCRLTGMEAANAGMYDGGTALFEAMMMALRITRRTRVVVSEAVSPLFRRILAAHSLNLDVEIVTVPAGGGASSDPDALGAALDDRTACVIVQYPNFFGGVEDFSGLAAAAHERGALALCAVYPTALSVLKTPGEMNFDVVAAEGQCLGVPPSFGGPYPGLLAVKKEYMRKMPGRVAGRTRDLDGREGFVLTLQTREQHIRREHAASNICSNENLCALAVLVYLTVIGKTGFVKVGKQCMAKAVFAREALLKLPGVKPVGAGAFFNEFVIELPEDAGMLTKKMLAQGFAPGLPLGLFYPDRRDQLLIAVTEKRSRDEIENFVRALEECL